VQLTFGQKLLVTFGILLVLVMGAITVVGDMRLKSTTSTYIDALIEDAVVQNTSSIAEWLNTRLVMTEAVAESLENAQSDGQRRNILKTVSTGGGFINVYLGNKEGRMLMESTAAEATLPAGFDPRGRPWYKKGMAEGKASFTEPYRDASSGEMIITALAPVSGGSNGGVAGADISLSAIEKMLGTITLAETGYAGLVNDKGVVLFHPDSKLIGENIKDLIGVPPKFDGHRQFYESGDVAWRVAFHPIKDARGVDWYLGTFVNVDKINAPMQSARTTGMIIALAGSFNSFIENIQVVVHDVQRGSDDLATNVVALKKTASASQASLETVDQSRDAVRKLAQEVNAAAEVINNLGKDVTSITSVLEVIQGIAEQTNLLALNAAIEAARAGDAGRGFAVVADEVRNLAQRTQTSTKEINSMIERLQKGADDAVAGMNASKAVSNVSMEKAQDAMEALNRVADAITSISQMTMQIATASEEQTSVTEELNASITRIADQGQEAAAAASENDVYSGHIETIGKTLSKNVSRFRV